MESIVPFCHDFEKKIELRRGEDFYSIAAPGEPAPEFSRFPGTLASLTNRIKKIKREKLAAPLNGTGTLQDKPESIGSLKTRQRRCVPVMQKCGSYQTAFNCIQFRATAGSLERGFPRRSAYGACLADFAICADSSAAGLAHCGRYSLNRAKAPCGSRLAIVFSGQARAPFARTESL